ncbi:hypothetical protein LDO31_15085 [Luteimonas sp. XNQY3]|nr:hypothetical protein [Luteimonas sp. XNQY3]MCD9007538.1 hypothetical protein [Luteimonas sp. XNQY3]
MISFTPWEWYLVIVGLGWWLCLPAGLLAAWLAWRRRPLPPAWRAVAAVLALLLLGPLACFALSWIDDWHDGRQYARRTWHLDHAATVAGLDLPAGSRVQLAPSFDPARRAQARPGDIARIELAQPVPLFGALLEGRLAYGDDRWIGTLPSPQRVQGLACMPGPIAFRDTGDLWHCQGEGGALLHAADPPAAMPACPAATDASLSIRPSAPRRHYRLTDPQGRRCTGITGEDGAVGGIELLPDSVIERSRFDPAVYHIKQPGKAASILEILGRADD